jgi:hypothetical protein
VRLSLPAPIVRPLNFLAPYFTAPAAARALRDLCTLAVIMVAARLVLGDFSSYVSARDLLQYDENLYLSFALNGAVEGRLVGEWAPLYALLLRGLHALSGDTLQTYYLGGYLCSLLVAPTWFAFARALRVPPAWAALSATAWMVAAVSLQWVRVNLVCCVLLWILLAVAARLRSTVASWSFTTCALIAGSLVRPELLWAAVLACAIALVHLRWRGHSWSRVWLALAPASLLMALLWWQLGSPIGGSRTMLAFNQHLAYWLAQTTGEIFVAPETAFLRRHGLLEQSLLAFALHHPGELVQFLSHNAWLLVSETMWTAALPVPGAMKMTSGLEALPMIATFVGSAIWRWRTRSAPWRDAPLPLLVGIGLPALVTLASCVIIYPWPRYLAIVIAALMVVLLPRETPVLVPPAKPKFHAALPATLVLCFGIIAPTYASTSAAARKDFDVMILGLRDWQAGRFVDVFDTFHWTALHLQPQGRRTVGRGKRFASEIRSPNPPDVIVITEFGDTAEHLREDSEWPRFRMNPTLYGYRCLSPGREAVQVCVAASEALRLEQAFARARLAVAIRPP